MRESALLRHDKMSAQREVKLQSLWKNHILNGGSPLVDKVAKVKGIT